MFVRSLYDRCTIILRSFYDHCLIIVRSFYDHFMIIIKSLNIGCTNIVPILYDRGYCTVIVQLMYDHCTISVSWLYDLRTIIVRSLYVRCMTIVPALYDCGRVIVQSLNRYCTIILIKTRSRIISHLVLTWRPSLSLSPGTQTSYLIAKYSKSYLIGYPAFLIVIVSIIPEYVSWRQTSSLNIQICVIIPNLKLRFLMILNNFK